MFIHEPAVNIHYFKSPIFSKYKSRQSIRPWCISSVFMVYWTNWDSKL